MKKALLTSFLSALSLGATGHAATLLDLDFEGGNDFGFSFGFSEANAVPMSNDQNSPNGNNGSEGSEIAVLTTTAAAFAGGGWGSIELANDLGIVAGSITASQLDSIRVTFDMEVLGTGINGPRFEASLPAGDFSNRVEFAAPSGSWANYTVDFSTLDPTQKSNMLNSLNTNSVTVLNMAFSFSQNGAGEFVGGDTVRLDNLRATTVPEPSASLLILIPAIGLLRRRRCRCRCR